MRNALIECGFMVQNNCPHLAILHLNAGKQSNNSNEQKTNKQTKIRAVSVCWLQVLFQ